QVDVSTDSGATRRPGVADWSIARRGRERGAFWSQSLCWGLAELTGPSASTVRVRFRNDGGRPIARAEAHLVYRTATNDPTEVTFDWTDDSGPHRASHVFAGEAPRPWEITTGRDVRTRWVELRPKTP